MLARCIFLALVSMVLLGRSGAGETYQPQRHGGTEHKSFQEVLILSYLCPCVSLALAFCLSTKHEELLQDLS